MLAKKVIPYMSLASRLGFNINRYFTILQRGMLDENPHILDESIDLFTKKMKKMTLDRSILERNKILVPAVRYRQHEDTLEFLRNNKLCPGLIQGREEFDDIDLVFEQKQAHWLLRTKDCFVRPFLVQTGEEKIRCTLHEVKRHFAKKWIIQVTFHRYIVGRPNLLWLPLRLKWDSAPSLGSCPPNYLKMNGLWVYCYNDDYPTCLEVEAGNLERSVGLRVGDFLRILPDGIEGHPKYKKDLNLHLVGFTPSPTEIIKEKVQISELRARLEKEEAGLISEFESEKKEELTPEQIEAQERKKKKMEEKKNEKPRYIKSLKKRVLAMGLKVKEGLVKEEDDKKPAKGAKKET